VPRASVLPKISRAALDGTLQPGAPSTSSLPLGNGQAEGQAAFGEGFVCEIVTQSLGLRERSALLGMQW